MFSFKLIAQPVTGKTDSALIEKYLYQLNREFVLDEVSNPADTNNHVIIDSLISQSRTHYNQGSVSYAPDKSFKVFVFTGESCGGNCAAINTAYITTLKNNKTIAADLFPIKNIFKMNDGKYLIIQKGTTSGGIYVSDIGAATLITVKDGAIRYEPIKYKGLSGQSASKDDTSDTGFRLLQYQSALEIYKPAINFPDITFDPVTQKLRYKLVYVSNLAGNHKAWLLSGYFLYRNGHFVQVKETKKMLFANEFQIDRQKK